MKKTALTIGSISIVIVAVILIFFIERNNKVDYIFLATNTEEYYTYNINEPESQLPIFYRNEGDDELHTEQFDISYVPTQEQSCFTEVGMCDLHITYKNATFEGTFLFYRTHLDLDLLDLYYKMRTQGVYTQTYETFYQSIQRENLYITEVLIRYESRALIVYNDSSMNDLGDLFEYSGT